METMTENLNNTFELYKFSKFNPELEFNTKEYRTYWVCPTCLKACCFIKDSYSKKMLKSAIPKEEKNEIDRILVKIKTSKFKEHFYNCRFTPIGKIISEDEDIVILKKIVPLPENLELKPKMYLDYFKRANAIFCTLVKDSRLGNVLLEDDYFVVFKKEYVNDIISSFPIGFVRVSRQSQYNAVIVSEFLINIKSDNQFNSKVYLFPDEFKTSNFKDMIDWLIDNSDKLKQIDITGISNNIFRLIAILPDFQNKGYGTKTIGKIIEYYNSIDSINRIDFITSEKKININKNFFVENPNDKMKPLMKKLGLKEWVSA